MAENIGLKIMKSITEMTKTKINEKKEKTKKYIFKKIDDLDNVIHILEATANVYYSPKDKMWNILLKARDNVEKYIEKEIKNLYKEVENKQENSTPQVKK